MIDRPIIIQKLKAALSDYENDCKIDPTKDAKAIARKKTFDQLITLFESNDTTDLTAILTAFKTEKKAVWVGSRLIDRLQEALCDIFTVPPIPPIPYYGPSGGMFSGIDYGLKRSVQMKNLDTAMTAYLTKNDNSDRACHTRENGNLSRR